MKRHFPDFLKFIFLLLMVAGIMPFGMAQISLDNGFHNLEISGMVSTFYNQRFEYAGNFENRINDDPALGYDRGKDRFGLRDMQIQLEGRLGKEWEYELQVDFADLVNQSDIGENPGVLDAYVTWKGPVHLTAGYQKVPYSRNSLVPFAFSPYWQRTELTRGEVFSRRDAGITLFKSLWMQRINLYAGAYTGMGEQILALSDNDPSGSLEYAGRMDVAWPSRYRYRDFDVNHTPLPMFQLGAAARTVRRIYSSFLPGDDYYLRVISGEKTCFTADFSTQWKGISAQVEWHQMLVKPTNDIDPSGTRYKESRGSFASKIGPNPTSFFRAGGFLATISYVAKPLKSIFSVRYDQFNPNDLILNNTEESLTFAWAYLIRGFNAAFKAQYSLRLVDRKNPLIQRFDDQLRAGLQFQFR
jgi:hypothetical protein